MHVDDMFIPPSSHRAFLPVSGHFPARRSSVLSENLWVSLCCVSPRLVMNGLHKMNSTPISDNAAAFILLFKKCQSRRKHCSLFFNTFFKKNCVQSKIFKSLKCMEKCYIDHTLLPQKLKLYINIYI